MRDLEPMTLIGTLSVGMAVLFGCDGDSPDHADEISDDPMDELTEEIEEVSDELDKPIDLDRW